MEMHGADSDAQNPRKLTEIDELPDDILIVILHHMTLVEAAGTSILSRRWRNLWNFVPRTLKFDDKNTKSPKKREKFTLLLNRLMFVHQCPRVDDLIIHFDNYFPKIGADPDCDSWICFVMTKEIKMFELDLSVHCTNPLVKYLLSRKHYAFPSIEKLLGPLETFGAFGSLRSLRLVNVDIRDSTVKCLLGLCRYIEKLCIIDSSTTRNLEVVDPLPNLKVLEISNCCGIKSLKMSAMNLVSFTLQGNNINFPFKSSPNLSELTLGGVIAQSFVYEPKEHSSYSVRLVKLVLNLGSKLIENRELPLIRRRTGRSGLPRLYSLKRLELNTESDVGRSLLFFTSLIEASPRLHEFKIKTRMYPFPKVTSQEASIFRHENLKVVRMVGYVGCESEENFLLHLFKIAPSLETMVVDTNSDYYDDIIKHRAIELQEEPKPVWAMTRSEAKESAEKLKSSLPPNTKFVLI